MDSASARKGLWMEFTFMRKGPTCFINALSVGSDFVSTLRAAGVKPSGRRLSEEGTESGVGRTRAVAAGMDPSCHPCEPRAATLDARYFDGRGRKDTPSKPRALAGVDEALGADDHAGEVLQPEQVQVVLARVDGVQQELSGSGVHPGRNGDREVDGEAGNPGEAGPRGGSPARATRARCAGGNADGCGSP